MVQEQTLQKKILILHTAFLGDLLLSIPFLLNLKKLYPEYHISLICRNHVGDFFIKTKLVDKVFEIKKGDANSYSMVKSELKSTVFDLFFCPHQSARSYFFSLGVKAKIKIGYKQWYNLLFNTYRVERDLRLPEPLRMLQLLIPLSEDIRQKINQQIQAGSFYKKQEYKLPDVPDWATQDLSERIETNSFSFFSLKKKLDLPEKNRKWICVFPGSVWETKKWRRENYQEIIETLSKEHTVFIMGAPGEEGLCDAIYLKIKNHENVFNLSGQTSVYESALVIGHSDLVIGNDSASSHLASVCNKKLITFFGPTVLEFGYRPWGNQVYVFENENISCRPCGMHGHHKCPIGTHECMKSIKPTSVANFIQKII